jgi:hypothetical protein
MSCKVETVGRNELVGRTRAVIGNVWWNVGRNRTDIRIIEEMYF